MIGSYIRNRRLKVVLATVLGYYIVRLLLKLRKEIAAMKRRHEYLMKLPQLIGNEKNDNYIRGPTMHKSIVPKGKDRDDLSLDEAHKRYFLGFLRQTVSNHMMKNLEKSEDDMIFGLWLLRNDIPWKHGFAVVVPYGIELARSVLASKEQSKYKKGLNYLISEPLVGNSVLAAHGKAWARQRLIIDKCFTRNLMEMSLPTIYRTLDEFVMRMRGWSGERDAPRIGVDVVERSARLVLDMFGRLAFSFDFGSIAAEPGSEAPLYSAFETILETLLLRGRRILRYATRGLPLPSNIQFNRELEKLNNVVLGIVKKRMAEPAAGGPRDLLDAMLSMASERDRRQWAASHRTSGHEEVEPPPAGEASLLSETELLENVRLFLFAGRDTTSAALAWFLYLLAKHPEHADQIRKEVEDVCGTADRSVNPSLEQMDSCVFLNAAVQELLRLYPSAAFSRATTTEVQLGKYIIPKGVEILIAPYLIQRNPKYFENPNEFIPSRWLKTNDPGISLPAQFAADYRSKGLLPFSGGPRNCVGRPLALMELRASIIKILQWFELALPMEPDPRFEEDPMVMLTMAPQSLRVVFKARSSA